MDLFEVRFDADKVVSNPHWGLRLMLRISWTHSVFFALTLTAIIVQSSWARGTASSTIQEGERVGSDAAPMAAQAIAGGMQLRSAREVLEITFCGAGTIHVVATPIDAPRTSHAAEPWIVAMCDSVHTQFQNTDKRAEIRTQDLRASVDRKSGAIRLEETNGKVILQESDSQPRRYTPVTIGGERYYQVSDRFSPELLEGLYGLGQHQGGVFNYRGAVVELAQANSDIAVPLLLSTNGYGLFWNTASRSIYDDRFSRELKLSADAADGVDYYVFYGPEMDTIIHRYRELTGHAPMFGRWAYGFIESKDRYQSAQELLDIAGAYRAQHIPLDMIVQDWFWWKRQGDPEFTDVYLKPNPDVPGALRTLHEEHVHAIISAWAVLDPGSEMYRAMKDQNLLIPGTPDYDPTNPKARDFYWDHLIGKLFAQGWDGFWLDSSEPEAWKGESDGVLKDKHLFIGSGTRYLNVFPLLHTGNVYDHWRANTDAKRVFLLTRSAFAGQQRNGTVEWSGDIFGTFPVLQRQVAAGLNFALSGMPYWTTDIAGYTSPFKDEPSNSRYQELYTRWFEFGTFCPILRTHGHRSANKLYSYGAQTPTLIAYDKLRSRLLPYTYSLAFRVTHDDYTIQRPLVMDWRSEEKVRNIGDQFMFGPSFLVNPVLTEGATQRLLYLPPAPAWYDFWTGEKLRGDQQLLASAPLDRIPLYVPAGSILPLGPESEYAGQQSQAAVELRIYPGANGAFTLYDDAGDNYNYEKGEYATVSIQWNDISHTLTFGPRHGKFPKMQGQINFHFVLVKPNVGVGPELARSFRDLKYSGNSLSMRLSD